MVPAAKFPEPSRVTIALTVLALVAVVAEFATSPLAVNVASLALAMAAEPEMSASTINELVTAPELELCMTPAVMKLGTVKPVGATVNCVIPLAITFTVFVAPMANPVFVPPLKAMAGLVLVPAIAVMTPLIEPPAKGKFNEASPVKLAIIVPAEKLPELSRLTIALAVLALVAVVAELATNPEALKVANLELLIAAELEMSASTISEEVSNPDALLCTRPAVENGTIDTPLAATFMTGLPLTTTFTTLALPIANPVLLPPLNRSEGALLVPEGSVSEPVRVPPAKAKSSEACPVNAAVMVPAAKFPEASRATIAPAVFASVAVVAELATKPTAVNVDSLLLPMAAFEAISASTNNELVSNPEEELCTSPADEKLGTVTPDGETDNLFTPLLITCTVFAAPMAKPVVTPPVNARLGVVASPAANIKGPVSVSPVLSTFSDAAPVKVPMNEAVMVPAEKLPEASRVTIALALLTLAAVVAELATNPAVVKVASFEFAMLADDEISAFTIRLVLSNPLELLCTTPELTNAGTDTPLVLTVIIEVPEISTFKLLAVLMLKPEVDEPAKVTLGVVAVPAARVNAPLIASPDLSKLSDAAPVTSPIRSAVMVEAEKLPAESRATIELAVLRLFAVVALLATSPLDVKVASLEFAMAALPAMSASTISDEVTSPAEELCKIPAELMEGIVSPDVPTVTTVAPLANKFNVFVLPILTPVFVPPVNFRLGTVALPAGKVSAPVIVSPDFCTSKEA